MKNMTKKILLFFILLILGIFIINNVVEAATFDNTIKEPYEKTTSFEINNKEDAINTLNSLLEAYSEKGLTKTVISEAVEAYKEASKSFTNEEIISMIGESKTELEKQNVKVDNLDNLTNILKQFDAAQLNNVLDKINLDEALNQMDSGATLLQVIEKATADMSLSDKASLALSMVNGANYIKNIFIIAIIIQIYKVLVRCIIFKKADEAPWAAFIPIYGDVVMFRVCEMSAKWLFLLLLPIIGWAILWIVTVARKFMLAAVFDKDVGFAFGLWLLWPIFEGILAFSRKSKYIGIEE